ncbi:MAG: hypothetical protein QXR30_04335 [Candidatus Woesearchaeota archaeon]
MIKRVYLSILVIFLGFFSIFSANIDSYYIFDKNKNIEFQKITTEDRLLTIFYDFEFKNSTNQKEGNLEDVFFNCSYNIKLSNGDFVSSNDDILGNRYSNMIKFLEIFVDCKLIGDGNFKDFECSFMNSNVYSSYVLKKVYEIVLSRLENCKEKSTTIEDIKLYKDKIEKMLLTISKKRSEMDQKAEISYKFSRINKIRGGSDGFEVGKCLFGSDFITLLGNKNFNLFGVILNEHPLLRSLTSGDFLETFFLLKYDYAWKYEALKSKGVIPDTENTMISSGVMTSKSFIFSVVKEKFNITTLSNDGSPDEKEYFKYYVVVGGQFTNETIYNIMFKNNDGWYYLSYNVSNSSQLLFSKEQNSNIKPKVFAGRIKTTIITNTSYDFSYAKANFSRYYIPDYGTEIITLIKEVK